MIESPFSPNSEILPRAQKDLWPELRPASSLGFVLYGGTAIALRLAHRVSVDFDLFTDSPLRLKELETTFSFLKRSTFLQSQPDTLAVMVPSHKDGEFVKVSFFGGIGFGRVGTPESTKDGVLQVASLEDLLATKVKTILQRVSAKDYQDIAAIVKAGVSLEKGLAAAREMFGASFQPAESLKAMIYFEGGDLHLLTPETKEVLIQAVSRIRELPSVRLAACTLGFQTNPFGSRSHGHAQGLKS